MGVLAQDSAHLNLLAIENVCVEIHIFCFLQVPLLLPHESVLLGCMTARVAIGTAGLSSGEE